MLRTAAPSALVSDVAGVAECKVVVKPDTIVVARAKGRGARAMRLSSDAVAARSLRMVIDPSTIVKGIVVDGTTHEPLPGVRLLAWPYVAPEIKERDSAQRAIQVLLGSVLHTGSDGRFSFDEVPGGVEYNILALASNYPDTTVTSLLASTEELRIHLFRGGALDGKTVDRDGNPIPGVRIGCYVRGLLPAIATDSTLSLSDGSFSLKNCPFAPTQIVATKEDWARVIRHYDLSSDEKRLLEIVMEQEADLDGVVVDDSGQPIEGARIEVTDLTSGIYIGFNTTDSKGEWYLPWIGENHLLEILTTKEGFEQADLRQIRAPATGIRIGMPRLGRLIGRVLDDASNPIKSFRAGWIAESNRCDTEIQIRQHYHWVSIESPTGTFSLSGVWPGLNELRIEAAGYVSKKVAHVQVPIGGACDEQTVVMQRGKRIDGRVVNVNGSVCSDSRVSIADVTLAGEEVNGDTVLAAQTDRAGAFSLEGLPSAPFTILVTTSEGRLSIFHNLRATDFPRDLVLSQTGNVEGEVRVPWPSPDTVTKVVARPEGTWLSQELRPDEHGGFRFDSLSCGPWLIELEDEWAELESRQLEARVSVRVIVESNQTKHVVLSANESGNLNGHIVGDAASDLPLDHLSIALVGTASSGDSGAQEISRTRPDEVGAFSFRGLGFGRYSLRVDSEIPGFIVDVRRGIEISPASANEDIEIAVPATGILGHVLDRNGNPIDASVLICDAQSGEIRTRVRVDSNGCYVIRDDVPGDYLIGATAAGFADDFSQRLSIPDGDPSIAIEQRLDPEARLHFVIQDDIGSRVPDARVRVDTSNRPPVLGPLEAKSDANGSARFDRLPGGALTIAVVESHHAPVAPLRVILAAGELREVVIRLPRYAGLEVRASTSRKLPIVEAKITAIGPIESRSAMHSVSGLTNESGIVLFNDLVPGTYDVSTEKGPTTRVELVAGASTVCSLQVDS